MSAQQTAKEQQWLVDLFAQCHEPSDYPSVTPVAKYRTRACPRCSGSGRLPYYSHNKGGECFKCHGKGFITH